MGASSKGGRREGSGAKPGQHRIAHGELRKALEEKLGMSYVEMLAETQVKLFNDFRLDRNVRDYIRFTENMSNRILANPDNDSISTAISSLTKQELEDRRNNLLSRLALEAASIKTEE